MLLWLSGVALAGTVYLNEVDVGTLKDTTLENVTVRFDSNGDVHIDAPQYEVQVQDGPGAPPAARAPAPAPAPRPAPAPAPASSGVAEGTWWMVTEDNGSSGHVVELWINGTRALNVFSGGEQMIEDVTPWLRPGSNNIRVQSVSTNASGGALYIYIGPGGNDEGTLMMGTPAVQFGLGASRQGPYEREYTIDVR
jgi:hypothetical protein